MSIAVTLVIFVLSSFSILDIMGSFWGKKNMLIKTQSQFIWPSVKFFNHNSISRLHSYICFSDWQGNGRVDVSM